MKYRQGKFVPQNREKFINNEPFATYRSSWELTFFTMLDQHTDVIKWGSECIKIPYINPLTSKIHTYIPDILMIYIDIHGKEYGKIIEIKPASQTLEHKVKTKKDAIEFVVNRAKWEAATQWAIKHGFTFEIMNEDLLYAKNGNQVRKNKKKSKF